MTTPNEPDDRQKALTQAGVKFVATLILVIAIFYASQYAAYTFMSVFGG